MNLLLLEPGEIDADARATFAGARAEHVRKVLGLRAGDRLRAGIVGGAIGDAIVVAIDESRVVLDATSLVALGPEAVPPRPRVDLLLALPRPKVLARLYAALACVGVGRVMLTNAAKVERFYFDTHALAPDFVRAHLLEGLAQARDTRVPAVTVHKSIKKLVEDELDALCPGSARVVADEASGGPSVGALARGRARVLLAIGPEGGWVDYERALLASRGFERASLGDRVLRADLACVVAIGLAQDAMR